MLGQVHATSEKYLCRERGKKQNKTEMFLSTERNRDKSLQPQNLREQLPRFLMASLISFLHYLVAISALEFLLKAL